MSVEVKPGVWVSLTSHMYELYCQENLSLTDLGRRYGISRQAVAERFARAGLKTRTRAQAAAVRPKPAKPVYRCACGNVKQKRSARCSTCVFEDDHERRKRIVALRHAGLTWTAIGEQLGIASMSNWPRRLREYGYDV